MPFGALQYNQLFVDDTEQAYEKSSHAPKSRSRRVLVMIIVIETIALIWALYPREKAKYPWPHFMYCELYNFFQVFDPVAAPAQDAVEYEIKQFAIGGDRQFHIPPSDELDENWDRLYNCE